MSGAGRGDRPVAVVTGAGRGVGRKLAERLARRGYHVVATDIDEGAAVVTGTVVEGTGVRQDVRDLASHRAVAEVAARHGRLAVWVNNAGVLSAGDAWDLGEAAIRRQVEVNLLGVIWGCNTAVHAMGAAGGTILNIASMSSLVAAPGIAAYGATKHGVLGYSLSLAGELRAAGRPITVSALCPDVIKTDMTDAVVDEPAARLLFARGPGSLLTVDEVAAEADALIAQPRLWRALPGYLGALTHLGRVFPSLGLTILDRLARLGRP